jgi:hypothetical protein
MADETSRNRIKLNLDEIQIESFVTSPGATKVGEGTVHGLGPTDLPSECESCATACGSLCESCATGCEYTCAAGCTEAQTCESCEGTCDVTMCGCTMC